MTSRWLFGKKKPLDRLVNLRGSSILSSQELHNQRPIEKYFQFSSISERRAPGEVTRTTSKWFRATRVLHTCSAHTQQSSQFHSGEHSLENKISRSLFICILLPRHLIYLKPLWSPRDKNKKSCS